MSETLGFDKFRRVLVLAAHTDDEFGCAGTMARLIDAGAEIRYLALSKCEESVPAGFARDVLVKECNACLASIGLPPGNVRIADYRVRYFPRDRQAILEDLVAVNREYRPDLVFMPTSQDTHQDHIVVQAEGFRAFKHATILGYELPQNLIAFHNSAFVPLTESHIARKIKALSCYASQEFRAYSRDEFIRGLAKVRGVQCSADFAEAFEAIRLILR
jgi:LmbE family N-acetylglucosaminyl deacetylase